MNRLKFKKSPYCNGQMLDSEDVAILPSGSEIYRRETKHGRIFQLFLNKLEYIQLKIEHGGNYHIHFYSGYYVYLSPYQKLTPLLSSLLNQ